MPRSAALFFSIGEKFGLRAFVKRLVFLPYPKLSLGALPFLEKQQLGSSLELTSHCCKYRRTRPKTNWQLSNSRLDPQFLLTQSVLATERSEAPMASD